MITSLIGDYNFSPISDDLLTKMAHYNVNLENKNKWKENIYHIATKKGRLDVLELISRESVD